MSAEAIIAHAIPDSTAQDQALWNSYLQELQEWVEAAVSDRGNPELPASATLPSPAAPATHPEPPSSDLPPDSADHAYRVLDSMREAVRSLEHQRDETGQQLSQLNKVPLVGDPSTEPARYLDQSA